MMYFLSEEKQDIKTQIARLYAIANISAMIPIHEDMPLVFLEFLHLSKLLGVKWTEKYGLQVTEPPSKGLFKIAVSKEDIWQQCATIFNEDNWRKTSKYLSDKKLDSKIAALKRFLGDKLELLPPKIRGQ